MPTWACASKSSGLSRAVSPRWDSCAASGGQSRRSSACRLSSHWYWAGLTTATSRWSASSRISSIVCSRWWTLHKIDHWLATTVFRSLHSLAPPYLSDDLHRLVDIPSWRSLRSVSLLQLDVPRTHRRTVGDQAFATAGPTLWNSLPHDITDCVSLISFCRKQKTVLLSISFPWLHFFGGPWRLCHFKNFSCMNVCMYMYVCVTSK